jgi:radical SAM protein with 4Fe4S-binding SPASM domain
MGEGGAILRTREPSLRDRRGNLQLLVWGEIGQWMAVDAEAEALLGLFDGRRTAEGALREHARRWQKPVDAVRRESEPVLREFLARGVLAASPEPPASAPEPLRIANLTVNLTNRCNLRCRWCYNAGRRTDEMPVGPLMDAIAAAKPIFDPAASFIVLGGEPLIAPERLWAALDRAAGVFAEPFLISTNGTLLDAAAVCGLASRRVEVQVSLDGVDAVRNDAVRGAGVFAKAVAGAQRLVDAGVPTILSMVYTRDSANDIEPYLDLALRLGVHEARLIPMRMIGGGAAAAAACPDQHTILTRLLDVLRRRPEFGRLLKRDYFSILATMCRASAQRTNCGIGRRVVFVDADGAVYPCPNHVFPDLRAGDLRTDRLVEIVERSPVMRAVRERYDVRRYTRCRACPFRHWCAGDCRGEVLATTGDPAAPSPHCAELRHIFIEMFWQIALGECTLGSVPAAAQTFQ